MKKITLLSFVLLFSYIGQSQNSDTESSSNVLNNVTIFGTNTDLARFSSFETDTPFDLANLGQSTNILGDLEIAGDIDPSNLDIAYVLTRNGEFFELEISTATYTSLGTITPPTDHNWRGLEFDPATNILYAISSNMFEDGTSTLAIINIDDVSSTEIGPMGLAAPTSIATIGDGIFYIQDIATDALYTIDITTGETTLVGDLGFDAIFDQDMEWDGATGVLWMAAFNGDTFRPELRTVDPTTGATTLIGTIGSGFETAISWISIQNGPFVPLLSVDDTNAVQASIFPNPTQGVLNINTAVPMSQVTIYNNLGQNVATYNANNLQNYSIDTNDIANGLYIVELTTPSGVVTEKFLKQ